MSNAPTNTIPASRQINNLEDTGRRIPVGALAERVLTSLEGLVLEILPGTNATPINLGDKITPNTALLVLAFVTASGAGAARTLLRQGTDYTVLFDVDGVGQVVPAGDESLNTLVIAYSPDRPDGTIGGQNEVFITDQATLQP